MSGYFTVLQMRTAFWFSSLDLVAVFFFFLISLFCCCCCCWFLLLSHPDCYNFILFASCQLSVAASVYCYARNFFVRFNFFSILIHSSFTVSSWLYFQLSLWLLNFLTLYWTKALIDVHENSLCHWKTINKKQKKTNNIQRAYRNFHKFSKRESEKIREKQKQKKSPAKK